MTELEGAEAEDALGLVRVAARAVVGTGDVVRRAARVGDGSRDVGGLGSVLRIFRPLIRGKEPVARSRAVAQDEARLDERVARFGDAELFPEARADGELPVIHVARV